MGGKVFKEETNTCGMKWIWILLLFILMLGPAKIVVVSNSIDYSPELIEYLQKEREVISITADQFSEYQQYQYYIILGGPDAPEGIGDIVTTILSTQEQEFLRNTKEYNLFIRVKGNKTYFVLAGTDREQTKLAVDNLKDDIVEYIPKTPVKWIDDFEEALEKAKKEDKLVYIDFYTEWCRYCIKMEEETYTDPRIVQLLTEEFVPLKLNREYPEHQDIVKQYNIYRQPVELVVDADGDVLWGHTGYLDADELYFYLMALLSQSRGFFFL